MNEGKLTTKAVEAVKEWRGISAAVKLTAIMLASFADAGNTSPRVSEIAGMMGTGNVPVYKALRKLQERGHISWDHVKLEGRGVTNNRYTLHFVQSSLTAFEVR